MKDKLANLSRFAIAANIMAKNGEELEKAGHRRDLREFGSFIIPIEIVDIVHGALCFSIGICCDGGCTPAPGGVYLRPKPFGLPIWTPPVKIFCKYVTVPRNNREQGIHYDERLALGNIDFCCPPEMIFEYLSGIPLED